MATFFLDTKMLFIRKVREQLRQPAWVVVGLSTPLLYLLLFAPLLKTFTGGPAFTNGNVLNTFVPGILALMAFSAGTGAGWITIWESDTGVIERLLVTPTARVSLVLGTAARDVVSFVVPALLVIVAAIPFGYAPHWDGVALMLVMLSMLAALTSAASNALGLRLKDIGTLASIVVGLTLPLTLLSGILLPLSIAPPWMQVIAHFNPLYYAVEAARALSIGTIASWTVAEGFLTLAALASVSLWWATQTYRTSAA